MSAELNGRLTPTGVLIGNLNNTSGSGTDNYNDLVNKPSINGVTLAGNKTSSDLGINIPTKVSQLQNDLHYVQQSAIPTKTSQLQNDSGFAYAANLATVATTGSYNNLTDKPTIPTKTSQLQNDSGFVVSSDIATVATTGNYNDLTNKPTIPAAQVNSDWNSDSGVSEILNKPNLSTVATTGNYNDLTNKPTIPAAQVNSDWNSSSGVSEILNKPTIPTNSDFSLSGLSDTTITTPSSGQVLSYDGSKWVNANKDYYTKSEIDTKLNYFINEKAVGVWIDNKIIYRCVFTGFNMSTSANTWAETTVSASNLSTLISGRIIDSSGQSFSCSVGWSNGKVALNMPLARSNLTTLILEYTKA